MFFDLSLPEIVVLLGLGVVLFGPDKLPENAARAARLLRQIRAYSDTAREGLRRELGPEFDGLDLQDLNPKTFVRKNLLGETEDLRSLRDELNEDLRGTLAAPSARNTPDKQITPATPTAPNAPAAMAARETLAPGERPAFDEDAT